MTEWEMEAFHVFEYLYNYLSSSKQFQTSMLQYVSRNMIEKCNRISYRWKNTHILYFLCSCCKIAVCSGSGMHLFLGWNKLASDSVVWLIFTMACLSWKEQLLPIVSVMGQYFWKFMLRADYIDMGTLTRWNMIGQNKI